MKLTLLAVYNRDPNSSLTAVTYFMDPLTSPVQPSYFIVGLESATQYVENQLECHT